MTQTLKRYWLDGHSHMLNPEDIELAMILLSESTETTTFKTKVGVVKQFRDSGYSLWVSSTIVGIAYLELNLPK